VQKLLLMSVILATFAIPAMLARRPGNRDYRNVLARFAPFVAVYVFLLLFVYPRLF
jgi:hypothetical protein